MTDIKFHCPNCNQPLSVEESAAGMVLQCPGCNNGVTVPQPAEPPVPSATPPSPATSPVRPEKKLTLPKLSGIASVRVAGKLGGSPVPSEAKQPSAQSPAVPPVATIIDVLTEALQTSSLLIVEIELCAQKARPTEKIVVRQILQQAMELERRLKELAEAVSAER